MDIEDAMYSSADLLSLRYQTLDGSSNGGSLLLSSPWPISSSPSPPSSMSSVTSVSMSSPSSSSGSYQSINEGTLLSLTGSPGNDAQAGSPCGTGILDVSTSHHPGGAGTVIFTAAQTSSVGSVQRGALGDPVSSPTLEVAHAPEKSILCVHEQHGDLIHFSTSTTTNLEASCTNTTAPSAPSQLNHVNGNANESNRVATSASLIDAAMNKAEFQGNPSTITDTDGNLFPTLILTSGGGSEMIPMRLYASLTQNEGQLNGSIDVENNATCILMTRDNVLLSGMSQDKGHGETFTLAGFAEQMGVGNNDHHSTNLGTTTILMDDCFGTQNGRGEGQEVTFSQGKLKDILMHGSSHVQSLAAASNTNSGGNGDTFMLRELESNTAPFTSRVSSSTGNGDNIDGKDDLDELKLHSEQHGFNEAITSIYQDNGAPHIMLSSAEPQSSSTNGYNSRILTIVPSLESPSLSGPTMTSNSVIWSSSGGIVESVQDVKGMGDFGDGSDGSSSFLLKDDIGDLDAIEDDDLLEAKEEMDDELFEDGDEGDDGTGVKGELKCKYCGFVCCSKSSLGIHERRHTGERPFSCKYCGRLFNSAQCCKHHERLHTGDKPFQCSYCGKKYAVSTRLKRHERVHTREEPYKCVECNKTFRWFDAFRDHRNTHTGVPLYLCSVCGKTFTSYLKFYYHERGHLMKKERDRDRLIKQRLANGLAPSLTPWPTKRLHYSKLRSLPISHTIDILKSLQRNSSASVLSSLAQQAQLNSLSNGVITKGAKQTKKASAKAPKKQANHT